MTETPGYHIAAVARITGLSVDAIRSWERRYGLIRPNRDAAGLRVYTEAEIARLKLVRAATERGHPIRKVAKLDDGALAALVNEELPAIAPAAGPSQAETIVAALLDALRNNDADRLRRTIVAAVILVDLRDMVLDILVPLMREIGNRWSAGDVSVWQEHLVSALVSSAGGMLTRVADTASGRRGFLFATPPFEQHAFGIGFAAMLAVAHGLRAYNLGPNVPAAEVIDAAKRLRVDDVLIGITRTDVDPAEVVAYLRQLDGPGLRGVGLWVGGSTGHQYVRALGGRRFRAIATLEEFAAELERLQ